MPHPTHEFLYEKLLRYAAGRQNLPWQPDPSVKTAANDARIMQIAESGVAVASVGIPQRNMHTQVEIVSLTDIQNAITLLANFVKSVTDQTDFRPFHFER